MLQAGQAFQEPRTSSMDEQARSNPGIGIAQAMEDLGPAIDPVGIGGREADVEFRVLSGHGGAVALPAEDISFRHEPGSWVGDFRNAEEELHGRLFNTCLDQGCDIYAFPVGGVEADGLGPFPVFRDLRKQR